MKQQLFDPSLQVEDQRPEKSALLDFLFKLIPSNEKADEELWRQEEMKRQDEIYRRQVEGELKEADQGHPPLRDLKGNTYRNLDDYIMRHRNGN